ncbi:MAG TPA: 6-phosphogluconate dehydrogenase [Rhizobiales bacterium]|jgi:3-hydroxyisobutyrate dehydrogenase-like beta-hydroxyacid dehydrogenase|nr:6-phosphogluconate dehydrogenase [Hyphomicrobiales bacterium]HAN63021.1 6-phosphogluconate dehydrogenase [Hyphomicrobiales bacterium]HBR26157.1 6-phosphogluconate dehydrogenase [Hyphomicrobiales bacterium]HCL61419.1 6-phosphogluconate dehydrogenase [Hyphomicrobiales bacterium]
MQVGFIGLGRMGSAMAANLLAAGHALTVYNRTAAKAEPLVSQGAHLAKTPGEAARGAVAITMLADDHAVEDAVLGRDGILTALAPGAIHLSMSTISVALAERLEAAHRERGQELVSAPMFGRPEAASAAKLFIVAAGPRQAVATCRPLFDVLGQRTFHISEEAHAASLVKLSGNFLIASVIEALSEAFALVSKAGIDRAQYLDLLTNTLFGAPVYKTYGALIAEERYHPAGFKAELGYKDVRLALSAAQGLEVPMPLASLIADRFLALLAARGSDLDWSALALIAKRDAGGETPLGPSE